jgi:hypothetical protein
MVVSVISGKFSLGMVTYAVPPRIRKMAIKTYIMVLFLMAQTDIPKEVLDLFSRLIRHW